MNGQNDGVVDTNVFIHAQTNDPLRDEYARFLYALEQGTVVARLEPLVLHELSYALPRVVKQMTPLDVASYLLMILDWPGIRGEVELMRDAVQGWIETSGLSFVDAYLASLAVRDDRVVYTKNVRVLIGQGVTVPNPLPTSSVD